MQKHEIIDQYLADREPLNPQLLGWQKESNYYTKGSYKLISDKHGHSIETESALYFDGYISNQGELRILMKMLNI